MTSGPLHGLLLVDKPGGLTSHDVIHRLRRTTGERRIGHGGTLDPLATGVLPVLFGVATRLARFLPHDPKIYRVSARLGFETDTGDTDGTPISDHRPVALAQDEVTRAIACLERVEEQLPPMYSAKKVAGRRLYVSARRGEVVERAAIPIKVYSLTLLGRREDELDLEVACSPGTYVRSLVVDLGRLLATGATVSGLRRLANGSLTLADAVPLSDLGERQAVADRLVGLDRVPLALDSIHLGERETGAFCSGQPVAPDEPALSRWLAARDRAGRLIGIGEPLEGGRLVRPRVVLPMGNRSNAGTGATE